jgi:hypothetical protein
LIEQASDGLVRRRPLPHGHTASRTQATRAARSAARVPQPAGTDKPSCGSGLAARAVFIIPDRRGDRASTRFHHNGLAERAVREAANHRKSAGESSERSNPSERTEEENSRKKREGRRLPDPGPPRDRFAVSSRVPDLAARPPAHGGAVEAGLQAQGPGRSAGQSRAYPPLANRDPSKHP